MAYSDFATYKAQYKNLHQIFDYHRDAYTATTQSWFSPWSHSSAKQFPVPRGGDFVTAPSTATACDSTTAGAMIRPIAGAGDQVLVASFLQPTWADIGGWLIDRLSHTGGMSGIVTTAQTTNLPTAALTRYTSGVGVYAALEVYSALGNTDATWTVSYTNQAGTAGRSVTFIMGANPNANTFIMLPLQGVDTGVKSVESVTLTPSTGTAGNFGITLFKPLCYIPAIPTRMGRVNDIFDMPGWNEPILDAACLQFLLKTANAAQSVQAQLYFGES